MSDRNCCQILENLKDKPENCSVEQIKKCHGDQKGHPCVSEEKKNE